jgi:hypothetical protein
MLNLVVCKVTARLSKVNNTVIKNRTFMWSFNLHALSDPMAIPVCGRSSAKSKCGDVDPEVSKHLFAYLLVCSVLKGMRAMEYGMHSP